MTDQPFERGEQVKILAGGPHENMNRIATVSYFQENGDVVLYFDDQDEDEWVYSPNELEKVTRKIMSDGQTIYNNYRNLLHTSPPWDTLSVDEQKEWNDLAENITHPRTD